MASRTDATLDAVLQFILDARGFDFTGYKRSSIERRVTKRMGEVGVDSYDAYIDYLELHPDEFPSLFNSILINVTGFFRDPQIWEFLATDVLPELIAARPDGAPLRIWSAGCSSGEEAYTMAMVLARVLGDRRFTERVKIYATDIDEEALDQARQGAYVPQQLEGVPPDALDRFFERTDQRYVFRRDLRRSVIFGRNDLVADAPISRIDLLACRNTLMYFTAEVQSQVLGRLHFALNDHGVLVLGKSEMLIAHRDRFTPIEIRKRVFRKIMRGAPRRRERLLAADPTNGASQTVTDSLREVAFDVGANAQVVLDAGGVVMMANDAARRMFSLGAIGVGRPIQDLELAYQPVELLTHLAAVSSELRTIDVKAVRWRSGDHNRRLDVRLTPLLSDGALMGTNVTYTEVTDMHRLQEELRTSKRELEQASEDLQSMVEELETTNEELQSTNEELETTNEELQSANEELETMNEELQSANEELETMNEELRHRTAELNENNAFLETVLRTIGLAVAVVDRQQHIVMWNGRAYDLWGLTTEEVENQNLLALEFGLPVSQLRSQLRACLSGGSAREQVTIDATNRRGRRFQCRVTCLPLQADNDGVVAGVIMMMEAASASSDGDRRVEAG